MLTIAFLIGLAKGVMKRGVRGVLGVLGPDWSRGERVREGEWRFDGGAEIGGVARPTFRGVAGMDTTSPISSMALSDTHTHALLYQLLFRILDLFPICT